MKTDTIIRSLVTLAALVNTILTMSGKNPLPWSDQELYVGLSSVATVITTIWSWWKNNSVTKEAIEADKILYSMKQEKKI